MPEKQCRPCGNRFTRPPDASERSWARRTVCTRECQLAGEREAARIKYRRDKEAQSPEAAVHRRAVESWLAHVKQSAQEQRTTLSRRRELAGKGVWL